MDPMTIALIASAGMGLLKGEADKKAYNKSANAEAVKEQWSPFTGQHGQMQKEPNPMDSMMQSLLTGAMIGQQFKGAPPTDPNAGAAVAAEPQYIPGQGQGMYANAAPPQPPTALSYTAPWRGQGGQT